MPQMAPLSWMFMSLSFILSLLIFSTILHSHISMTTNLLNPKLYMTHKPWKW